MVGYDDVDVNGLVFSLGVVSCVEVERSWVYWFLGGWWIWFFCYVMVIWWWIGDFVGSFFVLDRYLLLVV